MARTSAPQAKLARNAAEGRLVRPDMELDFLYVPSADVAGDAAYWVNVLAARLVFAVEGMGARVAMLELGSSGPRILLTAHLEDQRTVLIYRVEDLDRTKKELRAKGWKRGRSLDIPHGPCISFATPGGQRLAVYQLTRPEVASHFVGRMDFAIGPASKKRAVSNEASPFELLGNETITARDSRSP